MAMAFVSYLLLAFATLIAIPVAVFVVEVFAALTRREQERPARPSMDLRPRVAVLVPAHNESTGLLPTLTDIKPQLRFGDRLLVIADNCTDDTAAVARMGGAEVVRRDQPEKIGKGYALDWGMRHLDMDPPEIVVMIDADCRLVRGALDELTWTSARTRRPVQAHYQMIAPNNCPINYQVAEFAWRVKNWVRPLGLNALHLPCQLMGTGMAFPWDVIRAVDLANGWIVEDVKLGLDLTLAGVPPLFCPSAIGKSYFPMSAKGAQSQRSRWEQGNVELILTAAPALFCAAVARRNKNLLALTFDMAVPPLSLLALMVTGTWVLTVLAAFFGFSPAPLMVSTASFAAFGLAVLLAWFRYGRDVLPATAIFSICSYVMGKIPLYRQIISRRHATQWVRTDRSSLD